MRSDDDEELFTCDSCGDPLPLDFEGCIPGMCDDCCTEALADPPSQDGEELQEMDCRDYPV